MEERGKIQQLVLNHIQGSIEVKRLILERYSDLVVKAADIILERVRAGGRVFLCGNGGSAADSQHLAAEMVCKLNRVRNALPALALTTDTSILTAVANDFSFASIFERQLEALAKPGDLLLAITTSGNSENVIRALRYAQKLGMKTILFSGKGGGKLGEAADVTIIIPSQNTQHIQEAHIMLGHILCDALEQLAT